jgi:poly(A) polymerase
MPDRPASLPDALPRADWTNRADLAALVQVLGADNVRWVGGCVRDTLIGADVHDIDAATTLPPETVQQRAQDAGMKTVPTGIAHGTVTVLAGGSPVEVTTLRKDVSTDGRRATVAFSQDWRDDAARRDFTINALYAHPETLAISDYFGGLADLEARRVRFIGDARERIAEDHLRILRYYRFQARFGAQLDDAAENACRDMASTLKGLSRERVGWELLNLLGLPDPADTLARMADHGVLAVILPETDATGIDRLRALIAHERNSAVSPEALRRLAALLPPDRKAAGDVASRLRLSKKQRAHLACVAQREGDDARDPRALAFDIGKHCARDRLLIGGEDISPLQRWEVPQFPLGGRAIVDRGIAAGPQVAQILNEAQKRWVAEGFPDEDRAQAILDDVLKSRA